MAKHELVPAYTKEGKLTGYATNKSWAHDEGIWHAGAHVWVIYLDKNNKVEVLMQHRSDDKEFGPNTLDVSAAGHVGITKEATNKFLSLFKELKEDDLFELLAGNKNVTKKELEEILKITRLEGEDPITSGIREFYEEIFDGKKAIDINKNDLKHLFTMPEIHNYKAKERKFNNYEHDYVYLVVVKEKFENFDIQLEEVKGMKWIKLDELEDKINAYINKENIDLFPHSLIYWKTLLKEFKSYEN